MVGGGRRKNQEGGSEYPFFYLSIKANQIEKQ